MGDEAEIFAEPTGNIEGIDADQLLNQIERGDGPSAPAETSQPEPAPSEFEFDWNGKQIKVPYTDPRLKQWVQQGYDYPQRMAELNQQRTKWDQERQEFEKKVSPYKTIDEYARQNPEWWSHVESQWQNRHGQGAAPEGGKLPPEIQNQLKEFSEFKKSIEEKELLQQRQQEDSVLDKEVRSIRDQYKNLDWDTLDPSTGFNLEQRVLDHAVQNGIKSFRAAFRDYNHENLLKLEKERAMEGFTKETQKRTKLGLLGTSPTPLKGIRPAENVKTKSYDDLLREAKDEFGIG